MADQRFIDPDVEFIRELGSDDMQKCYQCATCAVVCPISPEANPFPRKEMIWAQWGLKDRLMKDPDVWLCHNCNDCSTHCPRGARPGDLLASIRTFYYKNNAFPSFMGKALSSASYLPLLIALPAVLLLILTAMNGTLAFPFPMRDGEIVYGAMFYGLKVIDPLFVSALGFVFLSLGISIARFWSDLNETAIIKPGLGMPIMAAVVATITEIMTHSRFDECGQAKNRSTAHKALVYSFIALAIVTGIVMIFEWLEILHIAEIHSMLTPLNLLNPVKIFANVGAIALLYGIFTAISNRKNDKDGELYGKQTYHDMFLLYVIATVALTGVGAEILRLVGVAVIAYPVYFCHLISVFMLIAYLPFTKFGHIVYRTVAIIHSKHTGRYELTEKDLAA